jgi:hypothetical protein
VRGPRQFGKSTWLEHQLRATLERFGPGTALAPWPAGRGRCCCGCSSS